MSSYSRKTLQVSPTAGICRHHRTGSNDRRYNSRQEMQRLPYTSYFGLTQPKTNVVVSTTKWDLSAHKPSLAPYGTNLLLPVVFCRYGKALVSSQPLAVAIGFVRAVA